jgi:hypothetical protein
VAAATHSHGQRGFSGVTAEPIAMPSTVGRRGHGAFFRRFVDVIEG